MKRAMAGFIIGVVMAACGTAVARDFTSDNDSLSGGSVSFDGYRYNCITYTKVDRGGLWCDRIAGPEGSGQ